MTDLSPVVAATPWVHDWSPFLIRFTESFGIRWYGLAYVLGFFAAYLFHRWMVKKGCSELREDQAADFITFGALIGVMMGGRLGYMLLYNFDEFIHRPWIFFQFLQGGMASHGGILGLTIFCWFYARMYKISWAGLGDNLVVICPLGVFFGRVANFINGELYGRTTDSSVGIIFPRAITELPESQIWETLNRFHATSVEHLVEMARSSVEIQAYLAKIVAPRHPSQLYEGLIEGLLLFLLLLAIRLRWKNLYHGLLTGLFFVLYAIGRILVENFREPDAEKIMAITRGQFYSIFMILIGVGFIAWALKVKRRNQLPEKITS